MLQRRIEVCGVYPQSFFFATFKRAQPHKTVKGPMRLDPASSRLVSGCLAISVGWRRKGSEADFLKPRTLGASNT